MHFKLGKILLCEKWVLQMLQPLARRCLPHRVSLYVDGMVLFIRPEEVDIVVRMDILQLFGVALGMKTNLQKSNTLPIRREDNGP
jgi:hypothetical protein